MVSFNPTKNAMNKYSYHTNINFVVGSGELNNITYLNATPLRTISSIDPINVNMTPDHQENIQSGQMILEKNNLVDERIYRLPRQPNEPYTCSKCKGSFPSSHSFSVHVRYIHYNNELRKKKRKIEYEIYDSPYGRTLIPIGSGRGLGRSNGRGRGNIGRGSDRTSA
ncbi:hypothetical protein ACFE04_020050 [Oxalis oulophora]